MKILFFVGAHIFTVFPKRKIELNFEINKKYHFRKKVINPVSKNLVPFQTSLVTTTPVSFPLNQCSGSHPTSIHCHNQPIRMRHSKFDHWNWAGVKLLDPTIEHGELSVYFEDFEFSSEIEKL